MYTTADLIKSILTSQTTETKQIFEQLLAPKLQQVVEDHRLALAEQMFSLVEDGDGDDEQEIEDDDDVDFEEGEEESEENAFEDEDDSTEEQDAE